MNQPGTMTKVGAATHLLTGIGAPINQHTVGAMVGWMNAEGGNWNNSATYNPLNTTLGAPGARPINSAGVKAYGSWGQGLAATLQTLKQPNMSGIVDAFRSSDPQGIARAIGSSPWGTGAQLVAQTIGDATGQRYSMGQPAGVAQRMASIGPRHVPSSAGAGDQRIQDALAQQLLNESTGLDTNGVLSVQDPLSAVANMSVSSAGGAARAQFSNQLTARATIDAARGGVSQDAQKLLGMIHQVTGGAYSQANHNDIGESARQVRAQGTDCSGLVSWLMGPRGLGIWRTTLATPQIANAPGMQPGRGSVITVWNNKQAGDLGHVFIQIGNQYFDSDGQGGIHQITSSQAQSYISSGSDGGTYQPLHPRGA